MRKLASIIVCAGLLVSISACSTPVSVAAGCEDHGSSDLVTASGDFGTDPEAEFPTPLISSSLGVTETIVGDGEPVPAGGVVLSTVYVYDGETGEGRIGGDQPVLLPTADFAFPFTEVLQCGSIGSRIVATGTAEELLGDGAAQFQFEPDMSLVLIADISQSFLGRANGADQLAPSGMPAIVLAPSGQPGFTFSDRSAPTELRVETLKKGSGAKTAKDDFVIIHYSSVNWQGDSLLDTTWAGAPAPIQLSAGAESGALPPDVVGSLVGQTVGSQLLIAAPGDQTVVYVVDVLGIVEQ